MGRYALPFLLVPLLAFALAAEPTTADPLMEALANPPATGMLVTSVVPETQAAKLGVKPGDVLVSYDGVAIESIPQLSQVKAAATGAVKAVFARKDTSFTVSFAPGSIGIHLVAVKKGEAPKLAPATNVEFDFSSLDGKPRDDWFAFTFDGKTVAGFEHDRVRLLSGRLHIQREVAFDGGERWGLNHFAVTVVASAEKRPQTLRTTFIGPLAKMRASGEIRRAPDGTAEWYHRADTEDASIVKRFPMPANMMADYLIETLASFMPREKGACIHFRPFVESRGQLNLPSALVCTGSEEIQYQGETVQVWRMERQGLGGESTATYYVDGEGRILIGDYIGVKVFRTTKEEALSGLNPKLLPLIFK